jgi:hypothetical protein
MGWSYGGFMTLMLLTADNTPFKAGAAGAPPTEWSLYDTHYTERFMGKPDENKAGYAYSDVNTRIEPRLKPGSLLLLHGMADDNVIFENSTRVMSALQTKAIPFEMALYPGERHSAPRSKTKGLSVLKKHLEFFDRKLKGEYPKRPALRSGPRPEFILRRALRGLRAGETDRGRRFGPNHHALASDLRQAAWRASAHRAPSICLTKERTSSLPLRTVEASAAAGAASPASARIAL